MNEGQTALQTDWHTVECVHIYVCMCYVCYACVCVCACLCVRACVRVRVLGEAGGDIEQTVAVGWMYKWWLISIKLRKPAVSTFIASLSIHFTPTDASSQPNINKH